MKFHVVDLQTGREPELWRIAREMALDDDWVCRLILTDIEGFAVTESGHLILLDECGNYCVCPKGRFRVVIDDVN